MLKTIIINNKSVPVPVPIVTLEQAITWVEQTFVHGEQSITRITCNGREFPVEGANLGARQQLALDPSSRLIVKIDNPSDLCLQTLDATRNLSSVVHAGLKTLAVQCWQASARSIMPHLNMVDDDLSLVLDLLAHLASLNPEDSSSFANLAEMSASIAQAATGLKMAYSQSDWKGYAKILLNRLEPELDKLINECASIQAYLLNIRADRKDVRKYS